jgi:dienelactone hydrolase
MASINARDPTLFSAAAQCHPAFMDSCDASTVRIPMCVLASGDEDAADVSKYSQCLKKEKHIETFGDMVHGWMSARADLENERKKSEYERGYRTLLEFFGKYLYGKGERTVEEIYAHSTDPLEFCDGDCD